MRDAPKLLDGVAAMVNSKPDEDWLVIHHKAKSVNFDLPLKLASKFLGNPGRLKFLTWGNHQATNAFKDVRNVILAGTLFYPSPSIEALGRAASQQPSSQGVFPQEDCRRVELGEHAHNILQALCRGSVRGCTDGVCHPCNAYVIAAKSSGIPQALAEIFPGATVREWKASKRALSGKTKLAFDFIVGKLKAAPSELVKFNAVSSVIGIDPKNLKKLRTNQAFQEVLASEGIKELSEGRGRSGFVKAVQLLSQSA